MSKFIAAALAGVLMTSALVAAPAAAVAQEASAKLSSASTVAALIANPKSKPILEKYIPIIVEYADMIPDLDKTTLKQMSENEQAQSMGGLTAEAFKNIEADLAKL